MSVPSPAEPLRIAVDTALQSIGILAGDKVYLEPVPRGAALPYIVLGTSSETGEGVSRYNGVFQHETVMQLKCWGNDKGQAEQVYAEAKLKLDAVALPITGHRVATGRVSKLADLAEPNPEIRAHQVVARYRVVSQVN